MRLSMNIQVKSMFSTIENYYEAKSTETAQTKNSEKRVLVIKKIDGKEELAIVQKHELSFWTKLLSKLGFGSASFTNVTNFIKGRATYYKEMPPPKIVTAVEFLNTKIQQYRSAHSFLFPIAGNPQEIALIVLESANLPIPPIPVEKGKIDSLVIHTFSQDELTKLEQQSTELYDALLPAKRELQQGAAALPGALKGIDDRLVPEFRFQETEFGLNNQCHRSWGTNLDTLVKLEGINFCYPANRAKIGENTYIQAEAPRKDLEGSKAHYYQMAIESDAKLLVSASTGFRRIFDKTTDSWNITPHLDTMDFLLPGESIQIPVADGPTYTVACAESEKLIKLPDAIREKAKLDGPCHYHVRTLTITNDKDATSRTIRQMVPDFVPVGVPFDLSQYTVDLAESLSNTSIDEKNTMIVNCNTGRDRSGQFIILHSMRRDLEHLLTPDQMTLEDILSQIDVVSQLRARAFMLAKQSTEGAGVDSIENTLLPCFEGEIPVAERKLYSTLSEEEKKAFHQKIDALYSEWAKGVPEFEIYLGKGTKLESTEPKSLADID